MTLQIQSRALGAQPRSDGGPNRTKPLPGQVVLVLQGGGAMGAFQAGAYQAMHEAGIEPDWIIGTSIGAINAALIAGNPPAKRVAALNSFWQRVTRPGFSFWGLPAVATVANDLGVVAHGVPGFFRPSGTAWLGIEARLGLEKAAFYDVSPLRETLAGLVDIAMLNSGAPRLTVGAVNVASGEMRYFDTRRDSLGLEHILASGALPPAFPAVRIGGEAYWDGGIYSNTPIEAVLADDPRRDSVIFAVNVWHAHGAEPVSIAQVLEWQKDIQYASRARNHIAHQQQLHRLRHVIQTLVEQMPEAIRHTPAIDELAGYGCRTTMRVMVLSPPHFKAETHTKDIDFSAAGIASRRDSGYEQAQALIAEEPWLAPVDPLVGIVVHQGAA